MNHVAEYVNHVAEYVNHLAEYVNHLAEYVNHVALKETNLKLLQLVFISLNKVQPVILSLLDLRCPLFRYKPMTLVHVMSSDNLLKNGVHVVRQPSFKNGVHVVRQPS